MNYFQNKFAQLLKRQTKHKRYNYLRDTNRRVIKFRVEAKFLFRHTFIGIAK